VLALLDTLIAEEGTALVFITHDIALVSEVARSIVVMRDGRIVEHGASHELVRRPGHGYTAELVAAARRTSWGDTAFDARIDTRIDTPADEVPG
jgi:ABC-type dipeptide/oligopeptide/nickel transport system ATPase component